MSLSPGTRLGAYEIRSLLGVGGMGEVYEAYDPRLRRRVALKVLPAALGDEPDRRERLEREAQAVAALSHPNIVTIYSVERIDDVPFLTMELVQGRPLTNLIPPGGLPIDRLLQLAIPLADAISAAHARGITHRDLKPGNVLVTDDGRVKVLDFGLAKLSDSAGVALHGVSELATHGLTAAGSIVGTVDYMSPEQAQGKPVDQRSDLFSLGILLYELATGERPFKGDTAVSLLSAILKDTPAPLTDRRPDLPRELARVIRRCLEKDPERRLQTAIDLRNELEEIKTTIVPAPAVGLPPAPGVHRRAEPASDTAALAAIFGRHRKLVAAVVALVLVAVVAFGLWRRRSGVPATAGPIDSVAVMPFLNASGSADADYLSDGLAETLTNNLAQIRALRVVPRTLAARYQGRTVDPREAGRSLNVRAIVTGRVVQRGDRFTVQAQLIDAETVAQLWGEQFDRPLSDVLAVQTELSKTIAEKLRVRLTNEDERSLTVGTTDPSAYQLYLRGQNRFSKRNAASLAQATEYYAQALARDPSYALAYVGLSRAYGTRAYMGYLPQDDAYPKAIAASEKAIDLDERSATAHAALAPTLLQYEWNWIQSEREFQRALALDPNSADVHYLYGAFFLANLGRHDDAVAELSRAEILDPLGAPIPTRLGLVLTNARRFDEAIVAFRRALALDPDFVQAHRFLALTYGLKGSGDLAIAESRRLIELGDVSGRALLAQSYAVSGRKAEATALLTELVNEARRSPGKSYGVAAIFAALSDIDQAFAWLEQAYKERDGNLLSLAVALEFDGLRADPRFKDLVRRIGIPVSTT